MNPSKAYTREERRKGIFVIEIQQEQVFVNRSRWVRLLEFVRLRDRKQRTIPVYMKCDRSKSAPDWITDIKQATPFKFELAHQFIKELDLKDATAKYVVKMDKTLVAV